MLVLLYSKPILRKKPTVLQSSYTRELRFPGCASIEIDVNENSCLCSSTCNVNVFEGHCYRTPLILTLATI